MAPVRSRRERFGWLRIENVSPPRRNLSLPGGVSSDVIPTPPPADTAPRTVVRSASPTRELVAFCFTSLALSWLWLFLWRQAPDFAGGDAQTARDAYNQIGLFFGFGHRGAWHAPEPQPVRSAPTSL